jgi:hypothetical protein
MIKISDEIREIISRNPFLEFGMAYRLFNLTQLAKFIKPLIEVRTQKEVQPTAILMSLSRILKVSEKVAPQINDFKIENIAINSNLTTMTFAKSDQILAEIDKLGLRIREKNGFWSITQSSSEITIFFENTFLDLAKDILTESTKYENNEISCIGVRFSEKYFEIPGILYALMQKITLQNINLIEITSTYTEFNFYAKQEDVKLTFETLHDYFL